MGVCYLLAKRKPQPCAAFCARTGFVGAVKGLGYVKQLFLGHTLAVILDNSFPSRQDNVIFPPSVQAFIAFSNRL